MPSKIGATIALDGEKEYREAIKNINSTMKVFQSEMRLVASQFSSNTDSLKSYTAKQEVLSKHIDQQKEKIEVLHKALADSQLNYRHAEDRVDSLKIALDSAKQQYGENSEEVKKLSKSLSSAEKEQSKFLRDTNQFESELNNAKASLNKMNDELQEVKKHTSGIGKLKQSFHDVKEKIDDVKDRTEKLRHAMGKVAEVGKTLAVDTVKGLKVGLAAGLAGTTAAAGASVALVKKVTEAYGELEQNIGGAESVFGNYANTVKTTAQDAYRAMGATQSEYLATANKMGALFQGSGVDQQRSAELTTQAMQRAADMASVMGIETSSALEAVTGAAKGNYTMMDNLGVKMDATTLKAYAAGKGYKTAFKDMSNAQQAEIAMEYFFEKTSQYAGNFEKEATQTISGSLGMLSASWKTFVAGLGDSEADIKGLTENVFDALGAVIKNIQPVAEHIFDVLPTVISEAAPQLLQLGGEILQALVTSIVDSLPMIIEIGVPIVMELLQAIISNLDLILGAALQLLDALMIGLEANSEQLASVAVVLLGKLTIGLIRMLPQLMQIGVQLIMGLLQGLNDPGMMQQLIQAAVLCTEQLISTFIKSLPQILSAGVELVKGLWQGITGSLDWLKGKIKGWVGNVMNFIKNLFGIHSPSAVMRDEVGKNLMLGIGAGIDAYAGIPQEAIDKATASLTATAGMTYQIDYIHDQIAAAAPPTAMTYSGSGNGAPGNGGTPLETVISLLQIIAANSDRPIVLSDGTLLGWMNAALGQTAAASERGVAV